MNRINRTKFATALLVSITMLMVSTWAVLLFPEDTGDNIRMDCVGDRSSIISPGETATYLVWVENVGSHEEDVTLEAEGTPEGWESELSADELHIAAGEHTLVYLEVTAPDDGTRGLDDVAHIGVRGFNVKGHAGTNNNTLVETVTYSVNRNLITETVGGYDAPNKVVTTSTSMIVYEIYEKADSNNNGPVTVKHKDYSENLTHNGTDFTKDVEFPDFIKKVTLIIMKNSEVEFGHKGYFDYKNRDVDGNPIQDSLDFNYTVKSGAAHLDIQFGFGARGAGGTRASDTSPTIDVISRFTDSNEVGSIRVRVPIMGLTESQSFEVGISDTGDAVVEVFEGALDVNVKSSPSAGALDSFSGVKPTDDGDPQGLIIDKVEADLDVEVEKAEVYVVKITGDDVSLAAGSATPPIQISPTEYIIFLDPDQLEDLKINADSTYSIEIKKYSSDETEPLETVTINDIAAGGTDTIVVGADSISLHTDSADGKTISITVSDDNTTFEVELEVSEGETSELKGVDLGEGTATVTAKNDDGSEVTVPVKDGDDASVVEGAIDDKIEGGEEDEGIPVLWVGLIIVTIGIIGGAFVFVTYGGGKYEVEILEVSVDPKDPTEGEETNISVQVNNIGKDFLPDENEILVTIYDGYDIIEEASVDLADGLLANRSATVSTEAWDPVAGDHTINVTVEVDGEETDLFSHDIVVYEAEEDEEDEEEEDEEE